jgi:hypothetical protein
MKGLTYDRNKFYNIGPSPDVRQFPNLIQFYKQFYKCNLWHNVIRCSAVVTATALATVAVVADVAVVTAVPVSVDIAGARAVVVAPVAELKKNVFFKLNLVGCYVEKLC